MELGEKLKKCRSNKGFSQEKVAELVGVSRQAVTKWESNQTTPSSENLIALASIYSISLDELADSKSKAQRCSKKILKSNLTWVAIAFQASALNVCLQSNETTVNEIETVTSLFFKLTLLAICSTWMALNLRYEINIAQRRKNAKIELLYCLLQVVIAMFAFYSQLIILGSLLIIGVALIYILIINPKYMNRAFTKREMA